MGVQLGRLNGERNWADVAFVEKIIIKNSNGGSGIYFQDWHRAKLEVKGNEIKNNKGDGFGFHAYLDNT